ncbi:MAG: YdeI/OmpD-associated family protein [Cyclobacteriaceae bacterium]
MIEFETVIAKFDGIEANVYQLHLPIPDHISSQMLAGGANRFICQLNNRQTIHSGIMSSKEYRYILINKKVMQTLELDVGSDVNVTIKVDESKYGMELPIEFEEVLNSDPKGSEYFEQLTPGKQRNLIYIVSKVKNVDSRISKSLAIMEHLNATSGKLDFKQLNQLIKEYNQRNKLK